MRKKFLFAATLTVVVILLTIGLAKRAEEPLLREGTTQRDVRHVLRPERFPDGHMEQTDLDGGYSTMWMTEPDLFGRRARYQIHFWREDTSQEWKVHSWKREPAANIYLSYKMISQKIGK
jgi:hypothetical protein